MTALTILALAGLAAMQAPPLAPQTRTVVQPVAPPATVISQVAPHVLQVTAVPGVATTQTIRIQRFADYDLNRDGAYNPMEFAQAMYFLATGDPVPGTTAIPRPSNYKPHVAARQMDPKFAVALINTASDEFTAADANHDWRLTPDELARFAQG
jgi:hypothetical protein